MRKCERESRVGLIAVYHLAMTTLERSRPIRAVGTRCRRLRAERLWYEACQAKHHRSSDMAEEASARRYVFGPVSGIGHISLHHVPRLRAVAGGRDGSAHSRILPLCAVRAIHL